MRPLALAAMLLALPGLGAALTVTLDQDLYAVGEVITITYDNTGGEAVFFSSAPPFTIVRLDGPYEFILGLPVIIDLAPGQIMVETWDTGMLPDPAGEYELVATWRLLADPDQVESVTLPYTLEGPVAADAASWSAVRRLFR